MNLLQKFQNRGGICGVGGSQFPDGSRPATGRSGPRADNDPPRSSKVLRFLAMQFLVLLLGLVATVPLTGQATDSDVQLYFFTSEGCAPCRQVEPEIEALKQFGYNVTTVDLGSTPDWGQKFSVDRTPMVIMVANQKIVGRHAGLIDARTLKQWFSAVGVEPGQTNSSMETKLPASTDSQMIREGNAVDRNSSVRLATLAELPSSSARNANSATEAESFKARATLHAGTTEPSNAIETQAMDATVRLQIKEANGISYATGTVIHSHSGEWLVMTCGHAFREAGFNGKITAEFNFLTGPTQTAEGELISYDSESRDVALVAVHAGRDILPVKLANLRYPADQGSKVFSLGCDGGADPTIRHSQIKNKAVYAPVEAPPKSSRQPSAKGALKYTIFGRPAVGRSGGGLFNEAGELIGVCNFAKVESDEGAYSALDSLYWQIAESKLDHLFNESKSRESVAENSDAALSSGSRFASLESPMASLQRDRTSALASAEIRQADQPPQSVMQPVRKSFDASSLIRAAGREEVASTIELDGSDAEVIIILRSKSTPELEESITINNPSQKLIRYLGEMKREAADRQVDMSRSRSE